MLEWNNKLHEVNYQIPTTDKEKQLEKLKYLFKKYGKNLTWQECTDNGFGKFYESSTNEYHAVWAYPTDTITFLTEAIKKEPKYNDH